MTIIRAARRRYPISSRILVIPMALATSLVGSLAVAQEPTTTQDSSGALQEVVVTALRRSESIQDAPAAITALTADFLDHVKPLNLADLSSDVPGLAVVGGDPGGASIAIRGISSYGADDLLTAATVGYYFGDTPVTLAYSQGAGQVEPSYFDVARVEVLRGPQGTLYGASAMGGTVRIVFNQPVLDKFESKISSTISNTAYGGWNYEVNGVVNLPAVSDMLAVRVSGFQREMSGYINRITSSDTAATPNVPPFTQSDTNANGVRTQGVRLSVLYQPSEALSITPEMFYQKTEFSSGSEIDIDLSTPSALNVNNLYREPGQDKVTIPSLTIKGELPGVELTSNTAYYDRLRQQTNDYSEFVSAELSSFNQFFPTQNFEAVASHQFTEEIRATSQSDGPFHWLTGVFYSRNLSWQYQDQIAPTLDAATGGSLFGVPDADGTVFGKAESMRTKQKAVFGELSYDVLPGLQATVGLRYYDIRNDFYRTAYGPEDGGTQTMQLDASSSGVNPKFLVSYEPVKGKLIYASATKGFRSGGVNEPVPVSTCAGDLAVLGLKAAPESFGPDSVWSYELGTKTDWLEHRLRANVAVYDIQWAGIQENVNLPDCGWSYIANVGSATSRGVELELSATPIQGLTAKIVGSYDDAKLTSPLSGVPNTDGAPITEVPKETADASLEYSFPIQAGVMTSLRGDYKYYGSVLQGYNVAPNQWVPSHGTFGLGAELDIEHFAANLFAKNVTNERGYFSTVYLPFVIHNYDRAYPIIPRTIGLSLSYKF